MSAATIEDLHRQAERAINQSKYESAHRSCLEILRLDPGFADAYFLLGIIATAHGNHVKALELIDRALASRSDSPEYLAQKARCLLLVHRLPEAISVSHKALALKPGGALTIDTLGVVMSKAGDHKGAADAFAAAVKMQPDNAQFHFNLGSSQQFLGEFDAAADSYRAAIEIRPDFYRAHWALSEMVSPRAGSDRIDRLQALLARCNDDAEGKRYLCHALAKEHERIGRYPEAFRFWRRGKEDAAQSDERPEHFSALFDEIKTVCNRGFVSRGGGYASDRPIFVVGMPRTGTTLVESMLGSHDLVHAAGELDDFGIVLKQLARTSSNRILDTETIRAASNLDFEIVGKAYITRTQYRVASTLRFVDKLPPNFLYAGFIRRALPDAKIVCLMRNPLDTCLSNYRQLFSSRSPFYSYSSDLLETGLYYLNFSALVRHWQAALPATSFMVTNYEALVSSPEKEGRRIIEFCDLGWQDQVLNFHRSDRPVATASSVQVRSPVYKDAVNRWRRYENEMQPLIDLFARHGISVPET